jgi:hypothetical protein
MNDATNGVLVSLVSVLVLGVAFTWGAWFYSGKISHHCQNYGKFTVDGKLYECKEVGVVK